MQYLNKFSLTLAFCLITLFTFSQTHKEASHLKYVTHGPDGSIAITISDDSSEDFIKLSSVDTFYKYQILDTNTSETVFESNRRGKECKINKSKLRAGSYNLRLFTSNFIITTKLTVSAKTLLRPALKNGIVAMNN